jgi:hypothetical protein
MESSLNQIDLNAFDKQLEERENDPLETVGAVISRQKSMAGQRENPGNKLHGKG